jgi:SAM-dependent methyltransferase
VLRQQEEFPIDGDRFSAYAHRNRIVNNPVSLAKVDRVTAMTGLTPGDRVLDVGAGTCELLIRLVERYQVAATAVEMSESALAEARRRAAGRIDAGALTFLQADAKQAVPQLPAGAFDLGICIGATHALGGLAPTLRELQRCVRRGGHLVIGEGYWKQKPCPEYLAALGDASESELQSHHQNVKTAEQLGLVPLWAYTASDDDWDEFEWEYSGTVERYCHAYPDDPECEALLTRIRAWRGAYLQWGRATLGFALYLFRND